MKAEAAAYVCQEAAAGKRLTKQAPASPLFGARTLKTLIDVEVHL